MLIRALLFTIFAGIPALASANEIPKDLSSDRAEIAEHYTTNTHPLAAPKPATSKLLDLVGEQPSDAAARSLVALDPLLSADVARRAIEAMYCAQDQGMPVDKVIVVDMNITAEQKRLWAFDLSDPSKPRLVINERVAHGSGSDPNREGRAVKFSNTQNSNMTSLGLYKIAERYQGKNGWSRRLDGLFARFNGKARDRAVVMHPSNYVSAERVGRSQGCPAVSQTTMDALEKAGLKNAVLWIDGPDESLAKEVSDCAKKRKAAELARLAGGQESASTPNTMQRQVAAFAKATYTSTSHSGQGTSNSFNTGEMPSPKRLDEKFACELTGTRTPRQVVANCVAPIDTLAFGHRII